MQIINGKPILHLNLKRKWFDMIKSGEKKEEYREIKPYWDKKFTKLNPICSTYLVWIKSIPYHPANIVICFSNGYKKNRDQIYIECEQIIQDYGKLKWGAEPDKQYFILKLSEIIKCK